MSISTQELAKTVAELTAPGKGILAADESTGAIEKRLKAVNVASTEETRRDYRELLFSTPGLNDYISGIILFEETLKQKGAAGIPLPELLKTQGVVPIVEPEVLMDGDHNFATCTHITEEVLHAVFHSLYQQRVALEYMLLKPSMVLPGSKCPEQVTPLQVAQATLTCLRRTVPAAVAGINFLSGGQSDSMVTANLHALNATGEKQPWVLSFSYGRALQASVLQAWRGAAANKSIAQQALYKRAHLNSAAMRGEYTAAMESE